MPVNQLSKFLLIDLRRQSKVSEDDIVEHIGDNLLDLALTGTLKGDVDLVKEAEDTLPGGLLPLRRKDGAMISAFTLRNLLTVAMQEEALKLMGKSGRLENVSGRLVRSALVEPNIVNKDNNISLKFRYQFGPYEVFDPQADVSIDGGAMRSRLATKMRSPRLLFETALKEAADSILWKGYNTIISQVGVK